MQILNQPENSISFLDFLVATAFFAFGKNSDKFKKKKQQCLLW